MFRTICHCLFICNPYEIHELDDSVVSDELTQPILAGDEGCLASRAFDGDGVGDSGESGKRLSVGHFTVVKGHDTGVTEGVVAGQQAW